ncbi:hypothetical protein [Belliella aquatica]|uniref:Uncharacterized protein n=1 Tax=Belliella aquatica TaxID=1323734 RepID=A0ABQ1N3H1_9BACT|nr:hypothetical protein [Belliella aquatica]MCH7407124.1 hypothetical protein [Belliella aquatica]GGC51950.1 hypothetical protein GCM10010993_33060 [Belliella aquatica]
MERSIENIWKEGFQKNDNLIAPEIDNLYNQKSIHIIDKFKRMFRNNLIAIVIGSFLFLIISYYLDIPVMGALFFITLMVHVFINKNLLNKLERIDQGQNSYQYLKAFSNWIKKQIAINKRFSKFMYPIFFLSFVLGFWFKDAEGTDLGHRLVDKTLIRFPETYLILGIPLMAIIIAVLIMGLLAYFGGRIYSWDLNIIYGRVLRKLDELMTDLESLRS